MKTKIIFILAIFFCNIHIFAEKYYVGDTFYPYTPIGLDSITPKSSDYSTIYPTISAIRPFGSSGKYEFVVTMLNCEAGNAVWSFPVNVTYIVEEGSKIFVKKSRFLSDSRFTLVVKKLSDNEIEFTNISELLKDE